MADDSNREGKKGGDGDPPAPYRDYSHLALTPDEKRAIRNPAKDPTFPAKLHMILSDPLFSTAVSWLPHGRSWKVLDPDLFESRVLPQFFCHCRLSSFMRQVNGWGFRRIRRGPDFNSYYHEMFLRGLPELTVRMKRESVSASRSGGDGNGKVDGRKKRRYVDLGEDEPVPDLQKASEEHPLPLLPEIPKTTSKPDQPLDSGTYLPEMGGAGAAGLQQRQTPDGITLEGIVSGNLGFGSGSEAQELAAAHAGMFGCDPVRSQQDVASKRQRHHRLTLLERLDAQLGVQQGYISSLPPATAQQEATNLLRRSPLLPTSYASVHARQNAALSGNTPTQVDLAVLLRQYAMATGIDLGAVLPMAQQGAPPPSSLPPPQMHQFEPYLLENQQVADTAALRLRQVPTSDSAPGPRFDSSSSDMLGCGIGGGWMAPPQQLQGTAEVTPPLAGLPPPVPSSSGGLPQARLNHLLQQAQGQDRGFC